MRQVGGEPPPVGERDHQVLAALPDERRHGDLVEVEAPAAGQGEVVVQPAVDPGAHATRAAAPPGPRRTRRSATARSTGGSRVVRLGDDPGRVDVSQPVRVGVEVRGAASASPAAAAANSSRFCSPIPARKSRPSASQGATPAMQSTPGHRVREPGGAGQRVRPAAGPARDHAALGAEVVEQRGDVVGVVDDPASGTARGGPVARAATRSPAGGERAAAARCSARYGTPEPGVPWWNRSGTASSGAADDDVECSRPSGVRSGGHGFILLRSRAGAEERRAASRLAYDGRASRQRVPTLSRHDLVGSPDLVALMDRLLRFGEGKILKQLKGMANQVNSIEEDFVAMSDEELQGQTADFKQRHENGETLESLLPEAFATVREASKRVLGKRHFDVQLMGGAALHLGNIAEMKTGEGKTLVATLPSYLNAITGRGVHVVTVNDYLAKFQSEQMGRIHHFLGMDVGAILSQMTPAERRVAYAADITYGTNNEFGFDYLRDNMALSLADCVQREHHFAVVDEVDSILIDEARTPLIISGPAEDSQRWYPTFANLVNRLQRDVHYEVDEKKRTVAILEAGIDQVEDRLGIDNLYESANTPLISYLNNAIKAKELFKLDRDYVNLDGEILIVDEHTGRTLIGRRYNEGLHQAIEAKEKVQIREEYQTLATITLQNYFRMYEKLSGMTGTALTEAAEFQKIYGLGVVPIPTNEPMVRADQRDLIYRTEIAKFEAIVADVAERHEKGQPVLIGTASVAKSETLSTLLKKKGVKHEVLNAKQHEREASIIALAGQKGAVTVATNMAGRGTDIILGGNAEFLADAALRGGGHRPRRAHRGVRGALPEGPRVARGAGRGRARGGRRGRRALRRRFGAPRVAPHRQPAPRTFRPPGRPGGEPLLPLARRRPDAAVQVRHRRVGAAGAQHPRRPADREQAGQLVDRQRAGAGRVAELRDPQEHPQVRRRDEPPAARGLQRPAQGARGRGHLRPAAQHGRHRGRAVRRRRDRGLRRGLGPRAALDEHEHALPGRAGPGRRTRTTRTWTRPR